MRQIPLCKKCGSNHWNMQPCPEAPIEPVTPTSSGAQTVFFRPREGFREGSYHLETVVPVGGNTFGQKRKPLHEETA